MNTTRMHLYTHVRASMRGQSGMPDNEYADAMIEHDGDVGKLLKALDDLGIANDTFVIYTTDNGPHMNSWPPKRKRHQLGRRIPRAGDGALARPHQAGKHR
jgi:arylsulfatase A-like enzyme